MKRNKYLILTALSLLTMMLLAACGGANGSLVTFTETYVVTEEPETEAPSTEPSNPNKPAEPQLLQITVNDTDGKYMASFKANEAGEYSISEIAREGYSFEGFFDAEDKPFATEGKITANVTVVAKYSIKETKTFVELITRALAGAKEIYLTENITITDTVYFTGNTTLYADKDITLTRGENFLGDMLVVGETPDGKSVIEINGVGASLTVKANNDAKLTVDGNKQNVTGDVKGTAFLIAGSSTLNLEQSVRVQNCKKVANERVEKYSLSTEKPEAAGGAAVMVISGTLNINGAIISNNEVNGTADSVSSYGGAIYNYGTVNMNGGKISDNTAERGGAIYNYRTLNVSTGSFSSNNATVYGGAIYLPNSQFAELTLGMTKGTDTAATVIFDNNSTEQSGGAIFGQTKSNIMILGLTQFSANTAVDGNGGAINTSGSLTVKDSEFLNNEADSKGGAIHAYYSDPELTARDVLIEGTLFESNKADHGGAVSFYSSDEVDATEYESGARGQIKNCVFKSNMSIQRDTTGESSTSGNGGTIYISRKSVVSISDCEFTENQAAQKGGAIYVTESTLTLTNVKFNKNSAHTGGAMSSHSGASVTVSSCEFTENKATVKHGGAMSVYSGANVLVENTSFTKNTAEKGGAIYVTDTASIFNGKDSTFTSNSSTDKGGAIYTTEGTTTLSNVKFSKNSAPTGGAMSSHSAARVTVSSCEFAENAATDGNGGAMSVYSGANVLVENTSFTKNTATKGGAIYVTGDEEKTLYTTFEADDIICTENSSTKNGGVLTTDWGAIVKIDGLVATGNSSVNGGVFYFTGPSTADLYRVSAVENSATNGGFVYITKTGTVLNLHSQGETTTDGLPVRENTATDGGSFIWFNTNKATVYVSSSFTSFDQATEVNDKANIKPLEEGSTNA